MKREEVQRNTERQERERRLEQERLEAQRIEDERKAKAKAASTTAPSSNTTSSADDGQSEWMQKVNKMNKKREEKRQTYASPASSSPAASPSVSAKKEKEEKKPTPVQDTFEKGSPPVQRAFVEDKAKKPEPSDDVEISEDEIMQAQEEVVIFNFEERVEQLEGYLFQKLKKKKWVKRWFMVKDGRLTSYSSKPDSSSSKSAQHLSRSLSQDVLIIPLDTVEEIRPAKDDDCGFSIKTDNRSQPTVHLRCSNSDDVGVWISGLYHHLNAALRDPLKHEAAETRQAPVVCTIYNLHVKLLIRT